MLVLVLIVLALGLLAAFALVRELMRRNGLLVGRVEALEQAMLQLVAALRGMPASSLAFLAAHPWVNLRKGTNDYEILNEIIGVNAYHLPASFSPTDVVIDIGGHIAIFSIAVLDRGCEQVYCYEPEPTNFGIALRHLAPYRDRVQLTEAAVWRSDREESVLHYQPYAPDTRNMGGGGVLEATGREVRAVPFDEVLRQASDDGKKRIRYVKLDCEGSEFPILLTSRLLHLIDEVRGEYHIIPDHVLARWEFGREPSLDGLRSCLTEAGFEFESESHGSDSNAAGLFHAWRPAS